MDIIYYNDVEGDLPKGIASLELATRTYPRNQDYWINLGAAYSTLGDLQKSLDAARQALYLAARRCYWATECPEQPGVSGLGRLQEAKEVADAALKTETAESAQFRQVVIPLAFLLGDPNLLQAQVNWAAGKPEEYLIIMTNLVLVREFAGRYREAQWTSTGGHSMTPSSKSCRMPAAGLLVFRKLKAGRWLECARSVPVCRW